MGRFKKDAARHYSNGPDWIMAGLDAMNKRRTGIGNHSQIAVELAGRLCMELLFTRLESALSNCVFYRGRAKRAWHLAPFWHCLKSSFSRADVHVGETSPDGLDRLLRERARRPFPDNSVMIAFDLVYCGDATFLLFRFDHRLLDARGAEGLLSILLGDGNGASTLSFPATDSGLNNWHGRFLSGRIVNRFLRSSYPESPAAFLPAIRKTPVLRHARIGFTKEETRLFDVRTVKKAGYLMGGIYLLACAATVFDRLFARRGCGGDMAVPVNIDTRGIKPDAGKIFFNHISFLVFHIARGRGKDLTIDSLRRQFVEQVKAGIPGHFQNACLPMRIAPVELLGFFMEKTMKKHPWSFSFSYVGEQTFRSDRVLSHKVNRLFHMPAVPVEPGAGVYFTRFDGRLHLVVSAFDHKMGKPEAEFLAGAIKNEVLHG